MTYQDEMRITDKMDYLFGIIDRLECRVEYDDQNISLDAINGLKALHLELSYQIN